MKRILSTLFRYRNIVLPFLMLVIGTVACLDLLWFYDIFANGLGGGLAQAVLAYHIILVVGMVTLGLALGQRVERLIRERGWIFRAPVKGSWAESVMKLWGHELNDDHAIETQSTSSAETPELLDLPARRGRKPTFPLERWLPIAVQWENRDPIRDAFTLAELISEHLGTNADGSPIISEQTYYSTWRPRAIAELRSRAQARKSRPAHPKE